MITVAYDYPAIAKQILKVSDFRQKTPLTERSLNKDFSQEIARFYAVSSVIATAIEPEKADTVAKKLLKSLDAYQREKLSSLKPEDALHCREEFVADFLKSEYK